MPLYLNWLENRVGCTIFNQPYRYTELSRFPYKMGIHEKNQISNSDANVGYAGLL